MDKYIIVFKNGETSEVSCGFVSQKDSLIRFCNHRKSYLDQQLKGAEIVLAVNESEIKFFKKVN
jgi:hypothetical protein